MIITVVCDVLGEENNGTTVAAMNLIKFLQQKGHTVRILCADQARKNQENVFVVPNYNFGKILNDYVHKVGVTLLYFAKFNVDGLLRGDYKSRMEGYAIGRQNGWLSINDIRRLEDMPSIAKEQGGDDYLVKCDCRTDAAF